MTTSRRVLVSCALFSLVYLELEDIWCQKGQKGNREKVQSKARVF